MTSAKGGDGMRRGFLMAIALVSLAGPAGLSA